MADSARAQRRLDRDLDAILVEAAGSLIEQLVGVGVEDRADIARRLNRRGFPCLGRGRWSAARVERVLERRSRSRHGD